MKEIITVSQLIKSIKENLEYDPKFFNMLVKGEINNVAYNRFGHIYFSLKDNNSKINCVIFKNYVGKLEFKLENGLAVIATAKVNVYEAGGSLQLQIFDMQEDGIGDLYKRFELLKTKLANEGIFADEHKKSLIKFPESIGVIAGKDSAALADIVSNLHRRWPVAKIDIYPATVQGSSAATNLIENLLVADNQSHDVILLCRGGGSFEDLNCFNDEALIRCIYHMNTAIVTGVGHQSDTTLVDYVADLRAATPTAAVELSTPNYQDVLDELSVYRNRIKQSAFSHIRLQKIKFINLNTKLNNYTKQQQLKINKFKALGDKLTTINNYVINKQKQELVNKKKQLSQLVLQKHQKVTQKLVSYNNLINAYGPLNILNRGYAIIKKNDKVVTSTSFLNKNDVISIKLSDDEIMAVIKGEDYE